VSVTASLLTLPIAAWELGLGVYMTVKGFRNVPTTEGGPSVTRPAELAGAAA